MGHPTYLPTYLPTYYNLYLPTNLLTTLGIQRILFSQMEIF
jgi:hypothetical protein